MEIRTAITAKPNAHVAIEWDDAAGQLLHSSIASVQSLPIHAGALRIGCTEAIWYAIGDNPTAVTTGASRFLPANAVEMTAITPGHRIAVLQVSTVGTVSVIPAKP